MTSLFALSDRSRVFGIPPGCDFSVSFLDGLKRRLGGQPPEALARVEIFTNTRRAQRRWEELLLDGSAALLPQIRVVTDLGNDPRLSPPADPSETALSKQLMMMQAVRKLLESGQSLAPMSAAFDLAGSLQSLLDEMEGEGIDTAELRKLEIADHSEHWQTALKFLLIMETVATQGQAASGSDARQRQAVRTLAQNWADNPPTHPVLIAGSTGSRGSTALLMEAVLKLPQGGIVLPGFDFDLDRDSWKQLAQAAEGAIDHPQFGFAELAARIGFDTGEVARWGDSTPPSPTRNALVSLAMRPAPVTDQWLTEGPAHKASLPQSTGDMSLLEAPNERFEASAIAIALRKAVEDGKRAVLITPDATLSRRVTADLERWGITPDDSAGVPLRFMPPAIFLDLVMQSASNPPETTDFLSILKHPLCAKGWERGKHLALTRKLDVDRLRDIGPLVNWEILVDWAANIEDAPAWVAWLQRVFEALAMPPKASLNQYLVRHRAAASALVAGPMDGSDAELWDKKAGDAVATIFETLDREDAAAGEISKFEYASIFRAQIGKEAVREEGFAPDKRVAIWGQLEARVQAADLVILGGLNEGSWPKLAPPDPWLSRQMRRELGLQLPERRIGLSAHDFQQAISNGEVILSRSEKSDNTPTVPSRWLTRLDNLLQGIGDDGKSALALMRERGHTYIRLAQAIDVPETTAKAAKRPCPAPPVANRPAKISVTQVERLIRDPYAVYASKILRLQPLSAMGRSADARDRGTSFHSVLENFIKAIPDDVPPDARQIFDQTAEATLAEHVPWPSERRLWLGRLSRVAESFIAREKERRNFGSPALQEAPGRINIPDNARALALTCKVDRIDKAPDGTIAIYDYKSSIPTAKQEKLFNMQLQLEAHMALKGGFEPLGQVRTTHLEFIGLSKANSFRELDSDDEAIAVTWGEFLKLVAHFEALENGYSARIRPMKSVTWGDYDHLARRGEWEDNEPLEVERV